VSKRGSRDIGDGAGAGDFERLAFRVRWRRTDCLVLEPQE
jgi:hypothetical protein